VKSVQIFNIKNKKGNQLKHIKIKSTILFVLLVSFVFTGCTMNPHTPKNLESTTKGVSIIGLDTYKIHTFYGVSNSHIIETPTRLIMIDAQFNKKLAKKLNAYITTLNKPLDKIILSHSHPDHWFGYTEFNNTPIVTTSAVVEDLGKRGQEYIDIMKPKFGALIPEIVVPAKADIKLGKQDFDGLEVILEEYTEQESHNSILIKIPKYGIMIGQDLFYNNMHLVASNRDRNKNWAKILASFDENEAKHYKTILVGHGKNTDTTVFQEDIAYLEALEEILESGASKEETKKQLLKRFPAKGGKGFINITTRNLFNTSHK